MNTIELVSCKVSCKESLILWCPQSLIKEKKETIMERKKRDYYVHFINKRMLV